MGPRVGKARLFPTEQSMNPVNPSFYFPFLSKDLFLVSFTSVLPVCAYVYHIHLCACRSQTRMSGLLELELKAGVSYHVGAGDKPRSSQRTMKVRDH